MTITNETILKAAKAAGLDVREDCCGFFPLENDTDNAMIRRGAEIDVRWLQSTKYSKVVEAVSLLRKQNGDAYDTVENLQVCTTDKAQAEREAVILCAAAKLDAMNSTDPDDSDINQVHEGNATQGEQK